MHIDHHPAELSPMTLFWLLLFCMQPFILLWWDLSALVWHPKIVDRFSFHAFLVSLAYGWLVRTAIDVGQNTNWRALFGVTVKRFGWYVAVCIYKVTTELKLNHGCIWVPSTLDWCLIATIEINWWTSPMNIVRLFSNRLGRGSQLHFSLILVLFGIFNE